MKDQSTLFRIEANGRRPPRIRLRALDARGDRDGVRAVRQRYEDREEIGRGGVGVIRRCHDADLGRDVAMKVIQKRHLGAPAILGRFLAEAQIGGQLQHPGIVPVYELGLGQHGRPYFTMKLVRAWTLARTARGLLVRTGPVLRLLPALSF